MSGNPLFGDWGNSPRARVEDGYEPTFIPAPVGMACGLCQELIQEGDVGEMSSLLLDGEVLPWPMHRECLILTTVGHMVGVCSCTDYLGMSKREAGIEAARRLDKYGIERAKELSETPEADW